jgi:hypothetical protein
VKSGGFVASQPHIENLRPGVNPEIATQSLRNFKNLGGTRAEEEVAVTEVKTEAVEDAVTPRVFSQTLEFVALPGRTEKLCREIPLAMREANAQSKNFAGCIVLISEEEARLVTVITLWTGKDHLKACSDSLDQLKSLLEPHVDTWMRTRRFISLVAIP